MGVGGVGGGNEAEASTDGDGEAPKVLEREAEKEAKYLVVAEAIRIISYVLAEIRRQAHHIHHHTAAQNHPLHPVKAEEVGFRSIAFAPFDCLSCC
ncbi:hypothetical protein SAY87_008110 [Trapa incisa]|uniref:Uncharacterized protein n=1 Tax=Trapa incisa TaxID=236973 RepID=A0AAN7KCP6_9MYRT|nr:hypothetical protein SAY87_008110 [Trapa incisa]